MIRRSDLFLGFVFDCLMVLFCLGTVSQQSSAHEFLLNSPRLFYVVMSGGLLRILFSAHADAHYPYTMKALYRPIFEFRTWVKFVVAAWFLIRIFAYFLNWPSFFTGSNRDVIDVSLILVFTIVNLMVYSLYTEV